MSLMPFSFNGLEAKTDLLGKRLTIQYSVSRSNFSPTIIKINNKQAEIQPEFNPYRAGGAIITMERFHALTDQDENVVEILM